MLKFLNLQPEVFGLDINDLSLNMIKLKKKKQGFFLASFNRIPIKPGVLKEGIIQDKEALVKTIRLALSTVQGEKLKTNYVVASLPEEKSFSQVIQMPTMTEKELQSAVPFEAENYIPLPIDKVYLDFQVIHGESKESSANHMHLLLNVMPKQIVDSYVDCFKQAGLIPCVLELESQAIIRALFKNDRDGSSAIIIDFGQTKTGFLIFSDYSVRFTSSIPISSQQLTDAIARSMDVNNQKAEELKITYGLNGDAKKYNTAAVLQPILTDLVAQIKKYMDFYQSHISHEYFSGDTRIQKIILCGGGARLKGLGDFLSKELGIDVEVANPFSTVIVPNSKTYKTFKEKASSFTTAMGLALRGVSSDM